MSRAQLLVCCKLLLSVAAGVSSGEKKPVKNGPAMHLMDSLARVLLAGAALLVCCHAMTNQEVYPGEFLIVETYGGSIFIRLRNFQTPLLSIVASPGRYW